MPPSGMATGFQQTAVITPQSSLQQRFERFCGIPFVINQFTVVQFYDPVGQIEIMLVVSDDEHAFAACLQFREDLRIEDFLEERVLIRSPFIEEIERTI